MISTFKEAEQIKKNDSKIQICVGEDRGNLQRHKNFGSTFIQPGKNFVTSDFCQKIKDLGLCANMFHSNIEEEQIEYLNYGIKGIMTDRPDLLFKVIGFKNKCNDLNVRVCG